MKTLTQMKTERGELLREFETLDEGRKTAKRNFTPEEKTRIDEIQSRLAELKTDIETEEAAEKIRLQTAAVEVRKNDRRDTRSEEEKSLAKYSLLNVMRARHNGTQLSGLEREWDTEVRGRNRDSGANGEYAVPVELLFGKRDYTATGQTTEAGDQGGQLIETNRPGLIEALGDKLIANEVGARRLSNLKGNLELPKELTKAVGAWETETGAANDMSGLFDTVALSPKRIAGYINYTMQMLVQPGVAMEQYSRNRLLDAIARGVNLAFFMGTGANNQPTGVLVSTLATGLATLGGQVLETAGVLDWDSMVDLETLVEVNNALDGQLRYVTNGRMRGALKTTAKGASTNDHYLWDSRDPQNPINGYPVSITNAIPNTAGSTLANGTNTPMIFGNWDHAVLASWSDIFLDSVNKNADAGSYQLVANSFWDVAVLQSKSFSMFADVQTGTSYGS